MTDKQRLIMSIYLDPNGVARLDPESHSGYCSKFTLIDHYPEEEEFIEKLASKKV